MGWETIVVWECEVKDRAALTARLTGFIGPTRFPAKGQIPSS